MCIIDCLSTIVLHFTFAFGLYKGHYTLSHGGAIFNWNIGAFCIIQIQPEFNESLFSPLRRASENSALLPCFIRVLYSPPDFSLKSLFVYLIRINPSLLFQGDYSTTVY